MLLRSKVLNIKIITNPKNHNNPLNPSSDNLNRK
jgi:hypothetical protein